MRRILSSLTVIVALLTPLITTNSASAAVQNINLAPTSAVIGTSTGTFTTPGNPSIQRIYGGQILNPNNAFVADGQVADFTPATTIPGVDENSDSYLFLGFSNIPICEQASIQSVKVHAVWSQSSTTNQNDAAVALMTLANPTNLRFNYDTSSGSYFSPEQSFGGLVQPSYSGNPPSTLTHESSATQTVPTLAQLKEPNTRLYVTLGENPGGITGTLDAAWLEIAYDDAACQTTTTSIVPSTPKTGVSSTTLVLISAFAISLLTSLALNLVFLRRVKKVSTK